MGSYPIDIEECLAWARAIVSDRAGFLGFAKGLRVVTWRSQEKRYQENPQAVDATTTSPDELAMWRGLFDEGRERSLASPRIGLIKLPLVPGERRYAVAGREGSDLCLTLWIR
jgi:hypothetical protein